MDPSSVGCLNYSLCAKYHTVLVTIGEAIEDIGNLVLGEFLRGFCAEARENLVGMVVMVSMTAASAGAFFTAVVVLMMMVVAVALLVVVMVVTVALLVMVMIVAVALIIVVMVVAMALLIVVMVVAMALFIVVMVVAVALFIVVMVVAVTLLVVVMVVAMALIIVVMMVCMLLFEDLDSAVKSITAFHSRKDSLTVKCLPRGYYDGSRGIMLTNEGDRLLHLGGFCIRGAREDDAGRVFYLVVIKLAKVTHIHLTLIYVTDGGKRVKGSAVILCRPCRLDDVGKLTDTRGLDNNSIGVKLSDNLAERRGKITDERAADTAGIHLGDLNARVLEKSAVYTDLTELVLYKNYLFVSVCLFYKLFYKRCFSRTEKSGKNINFSHFKIAPKRSSVNFIFLFIIYHLV